MTADARPRPRGPVRPRKSIRSAGLFVLGVLLDTYCVINVPGAVIFTGREDPAVELTSAGVVIVLVSIACWTTVFVRTRSPVAVLVAGAILMLIGVSYVLALVGVYHALLRWPRRTGVIAGATAASLLLYVAREVFTDWGHALAWTFADGTAYDPVAGNLAVVALAALSCGLVAGLVAYRRARIDASASRVRAQREHERADALHGEVARQAERERIARDLHDGLGHRLSSVALAAGAFEAQATDATVDPALTEWARLVRRQAHAALEDVRGVVGALRADADVVETHPAASIRMVGELLAEMRAAGHRIEAYVVVEGADRVDPATDAAAYRIVQESLTNAIKHAPGALISITVDASRGSGIRIRIVNDLVAATGGVPGGGNGIGGIRERASSAGGTAWIGPHDGVFIVDVSLPWEEQG